LLLSLRATLGDIDREFQRSFTIVKNERSPPAAQASMDRLALHAGLEYEGAKRRHFMRKELRFPNAPNSRWVERRSGNECRRCSGEPRVLAARRRAVPKPLRRKKIAQHAMLGIGSVEE
jgi:hypothetical protein